MNFHMMKYTSYFTCLYNHLCYTHKKAISNYSSQLATLFDNTYSRSIGIECAYLKFYAATGRRETIEIEFLGSFDRILTLRSSNSMCNVEESAHYIFVTESVQHSYPVKISRADATFNETTEKIRTHLCLSSHFLSETRIDLILCSKSGCV